jgi:ankyrin repeat protein
MDDAQAAFADPKLVQIAAAAARGDRARVHALAPTVALSAHGDRNVTLLEWAVLHRSDEGLAALLDAGADPAEPGIGGATVWHLAAMANDPAYLQTLIAHGGDLNAPHGLTHATPLAASLLNPDPRAFDLLLRAHADPNRADRMGDTPLHVAAKVHKPACVLALLKAGADPTAKNTTGHTFQAFLHMAPAGGLNSQAQADHQAIDAWLREHHVAVEAS